MYTFDVILYVDDATLSNETLKSMQGANCLFCFVKKFTIILRRSLVVQI